MKLGASSLSKLVLIQLLAIGSCYHSATLKNSLQENTLNSNVLRKEASPTFTLSPVKYEHYEDYFAILQDFFCTLANVITFLSCEHSVWTLNDGNY